MTTALAVLAATDIDLMPFVVAIIVGLLLAILVYVVMQKIAPGYAGMCAAATFVVCLLIGLLLSLD